MTWCNLSLKEDIGSLSDCMWLLLKNLYKGRELFKWLLMSISVRMVNNLKGGLGKFTARSEMRMQTIYYYIFYNNQWEIRKFAAEYDKRKPMRNCTQI